MPQGSSNAPIPPVRVAGFLYLITAITGSLTFFIGPAIVGGDAAATAANIAAGEQMWRLNFVLILIAGAAYVGVAAILYEVFKPVSPTYSMVAAFFGLGVTVMGVMHVHQLYSLFYLGDAEYLAAFNTEQLQTLSYMPLRLQWIGENLGYLYSGLYTFSLGCLILGSTFMPRLIGVFLIVSGFSWFGQSLTSFLAPALANSLSDYFMATSILGEVSLMLWILVMGVNAKKWREQAGVAVSVSGEE